MWEVKVYLYDLSRGLAKNMSQALIGKQIEGVWHTGVVVYGSEYYFSGGIQKDPPGSTGAGTPYRIIPMGSTSIDQATFEQFLYGISPRYTIQTYRLLEHNCNNFSDEVCKFLLNKGIPSYIVDLPREFLSTPIGQQFKPFIDNLYNGGNPLQNMTGTSMFGPTGPGTSSLPAPSQPDTPYPKLSSASLYTYESVSLDKVYQRLFANSEQYKETLEGEGEHSPKEAGVLTEADKTLLQSETIKTWFMDICRDAKKRAPAPENAIPKGIITILTRLRCTWPKDLLLPVFDIMRIVALHHKGAETLCKQPSAPTGGGHATLAPLSIVTLFKEFVLPQTEGDGSGKMPPSAGAKLMSGRMAVNLFSTEIGSKFITSPDHAPLFIQGAVSLLAEPYPILKQAGACLLQNISLTLGAEREGAGELNEKATAALSSTVKQACATITEEREKGGSPSLDTLIVAIKALGVLLIDNEIGIAIFSSLDPEQSCVPELETIRKGTEFGDASAIAGEICIILGI